MSEIDIDRVFWQVLYMVKYDNSMQKLFLNATGAVAGVMALGIMGYFAWFCVSGLLPNHESLIEKLEKIGETGSGRKTFVLKLSEQLGYKDNWRRFHHDLDKGQFRINCEVVSDMVTKQGI